MGGGGGERAKWRRGEGERERLGKSDIRSAPHLALGGEGVSASYQSEVETWRSTPVSTQSLSSPGSQLAHSTLPHSLVAVSSPGLCV